jgi:hypothetical protein
VKRILFLTATLAISTAHVCLAADSAAALAKSIQDAGLDPQECYRIRDISFQKDDLRVYLTEGHIVFSRPVEGRIFGAMFTTDVPGGDAEVIVFPPHRSERLSLASFTKTPNLNEHLTYGVFLFTDGTGELLRDQVVKSVSSKKMPEAGLLLDQAYTPVLRNIAGSYETRLVQDYLSARRDSLGFFYAAVNGRNLGNFDLLYDPRAREQISLGQVVFRDNRRYFDTWTSFVARPYRNGQKKPPIDSPVAMDKIDIDATLGLDMSMKAVTRLTFHLTDVPDRALAFELSRRMKVTHALVDGEPAETFFRDALRVNLLRGENDLFLVIPPKQLAPGVPHTIEFHHEGTVVASAGNGVYYVASRNSWYPNRDAAFARYSLTFRYPKTLDLVATGDVIDARTEGETRITKFATPVPVRFAGFNVGTYDKIETSRAGFHVRVYANQRIEAALQARMREVIVIPPAPPIASRQGRRNTPDLLGMPVMAGIPNPAGRLQQLATDISSAMEYLAGQFGPPPLTTLTVSPIPGTFGQGFPGLIYLSTLAYLDPDDRPIGARGQRQRLFFSELLHAHEAAHQWWGNLVTSGNYQDDWIMEGLATYSALMFLEKRKGRGALEDVLDEYRDTLLSKDESFKDGPDQTLESAGPIIWGIRLNSSQTPRAWRAILYEKGAWIFHMLRARLGDDAFRKMLTEVVRRHRFKAVTTENLRQVASEFMPAGSDDPKLESFFEQWVYGTGIPDLKLTHSVTGKAPKLRLRATITQTNVPEDFTTSVPIEIVVPGRKPVIQWIRTSSDPVTISIDVPRKPSRVSLAPGQAVLGKRD